MVKRFPGMDAWMREAEEASRLIEDVECRVKNRNPEAEQLSSLKDAAKYKLLELGVKLDRLESLLLNPPSKPTLTEADLDSRWKMLSDIQQRTRKMAVALFAAPAPNRAADVKEANRSSSFHSQDKIAASLSKYDPELAKPLLDDETQTHTERRRFLSFTSKSWLCKACLTICTIFGVLILLFALFVLCALI